MSKKSKKSEKCTVKNFKFQYLGKFKFTFEWLWGMIQEFGRHDLMKKQQTKHLVPLSFKHAT
jgi:hypothetical protein